MDRPPPPSFNLGQIQLLLRMRQFSITIEASRTAMALGFNEDAIYDCVRDLTLTDFKQTMPATEKKYQGLMQDVYYVDVDHKPLYVKLQMDHGDGWFRVVSFHLRSTKK